MAELHHPHATHPAHAGDNPDVHHEESDVNIRGVLMFGGGLIVAAIVIHLVVGVRRMRGVRLMQFGHDV